MNNQGREGRSAISRSAPTVLTLFEAETAQQCGVGLSHVLLNCALAILAVAIVAIDIVWILVGEFQVEVANYALLFVIIPPLVAASRYYYSPKKNEPALGAMLAGIAFLIIFPSGCCLLSYLMLTISGPRIDWLLASLDQAMGFSWPTVMTFAAHHLVLTQILKFAYLSVLPQTVILLFLLGWKQDSNKIYGICLSLSVSAVVTILIWTAFPAFGAFSVFDLPTPIAGKLGLALSGNYGHALIGMLKNGPGLISPRELRGIIGFPSYHTVQALVLIWYSRSLPYLRWISLALNTAVLISVPIHGGHHLIDMFGGMAVTIICVFLSAKFVSYAEKIRMHKSQLSPVLAHC